LIKEITVRIYLCDYIEKEKTLASRHLVSSIGICRDKETRVFNESELPKDLLRVLKLRGEVEVFDKELCLNLFNIALVGNQYLKLKIEEQ